MVVFKAALIFLVSCQSLKPQKILWNWGAQRSSGTWLCGTYGVMPKAIFFIDWVDHGEGVFEVRGPMDELRGRFSCDQRRCWGQGVETKGGDFYWEGNNLGHAFVWSALLRERIPWKGNWMVSRRGWFQGPWVVRQDEGWRVQHRGFPWAWTLKDGEWSWGTGDVGVSCRINDDES